MNRHILRLAVPNIISNISIPLLGLADMALLGHLGSEVYLGAIAVGSMVFNILYWGFGFLRMGTSGFAAQAYGRRHFTESLQVLARALLVAWGGALLLVVLQVPIRWAGFSLLDASPEVERWAASYFSIRIFAAPATIGLYAFTGWFIGMQDVRSPMFVSILVNVLNIGLNVLFVFGLGLKSDGVAWGTLMAQYTGLLAALWIFRRYYGRLLPYWDPRGLWLRTAFVRFFKVNSDIFLRTLCLIFVFTYFTSSSAASNNLVLAANTLLLQFFMFFSYLIDGFAYAAEALTGKAIGAKNQALLKRSVHLLFVWGIALAVIFTAIYGGLHRQILQLLTSQEDVLQVAYQYGAWVVAIPLLSFASFIWDGVYIGATASRAMRNTMLIATLGVFVPVEFFLAQTLGNHALWLALTGFLLARGLAQTVWARWAIHI